MKTLAMYKMEKNFIAVNTKHYPQRPYEDLSTRYLLDRLHEELQELEDEYTEQEMRLMRIKFMSELGN